MLFFHTVAPAKYKRSIVAGMVNRVYRSCSSGCLFNGFIKFGMSILEKNRYPPAFYNLIVRKALTDIIIADHDKPKNQRKVMPKFLLLFSTVVPLSTVF